MDRRGFLPLDEEHQYAVGYRRSEAAPPIDGDSHARRRTLNLVTLVAIQTK